MNWKTQVQLGDLDHAARFEVTCRRCGTARFVTAGELCARGDFSRLWLDEIERRAKCRQCGGAMRLAIPHTGETKGFVGGIA